MPMTQEDADNVGKLLVYALRPLDDRLSTIEKRLGIAPPVKAAADSTPIATLSAAETLAATLKELG